MPKYELESRFTQPNDICPHPEYWLSSDGDSTELQVSIMIAGLVKGIQPEFCIETGSAWGQTSERIGEALRDNGHGELVSFEIDQERVDFCKNRCHGLPVEIKMMPSLDYEPDREITFAFFDSLFHLRIPEFLKFQPYIKRGSIVAFHDTSSYHGGGGSGLRVAIETQLSSYLRFIHLPTPRGITIGEVL